MEIRTDCRQRFVDDRLDSFGWHALVSSFDSKDGVFEDLPTDSFLHVFRQVLFSEAFLSEMGPKPRIDLFGNVE
jgi:hypothetical protein